MDIFEFVGKIVFEDVPELITEKIPREAGKTLDNISEAIDNFLSDQRGFWKMTKYCISYECFKQWLESEL